MPVKQVPAVIKSFLQWFHRCQKMGEKDGIPELDGARLILWSERNILLLDKLPNSRV
jgi:hypothetical protein